MLCNLKGTTPSCLLFFYNKENELQVVAPVYKRSLALYLYFTWKESQMINTSGKNARSNHTIKYSLFDSVSCAGFVEVFLRSLQRLLLSNVASWVTRCGSHLPFYAHTFWPGCRIDLWTLAHKINLARAPGQMKSLARAPHHVKNIPSP